jgi:predicted CoA-binding protein
MKVLVYGASTNSERYAHKAALLLLEEGYEVVWIGQKSGQIAGVEIGLENEMYSDIDTVTLYVGPKNQGELYDYLKDLNPKRVIFNPGTENEDLENHLMQAGIEVELACTLVLLHTGQFES